MAKIVLGISASIAAYKLISVTHELIKNSHEVKVILTKHASNFVTPTSFSAFGANVYTDEINYNSAIDIMEHINLAKWADLILIAPATANTIAKLSYGFADNLLNATVLACDKPKFIVPAMNKYMWSNSITQENIERLTKHKFKIWGPSSGLQACGDDGDGRMIESIEVLEQINKYLSINEKNVIAK